MNQQHLNMNFTSELETDNSLAFLDVFVTRSNGPFIISVYRKPTFSGVYTNFDSYIPESYKYGLVYTLLYRSYSIYTSWDKLKVILRKSVRLCVKTVILLPCLIRHLRTFSKNCIEPRKSNLREM